MIKEYIANNTRTTFLPTRKVIDLTRMDKDATNKIKFEDIKESALMKPQPCKCHERNLTSKNKIKHTFVRTNNKQDIQNLLIEHPELKQFEHIISSSFQDRVKVNSTTSQQDTHKQLRINFLKKLPGSKGNGSSFIKDIWRLLDCSKLKQNQHQASRNLPHMTKPNTVQEGKELKNTLEDLGLILTPLEK